MVDPERAQRAREIAAKALGREPAQQRRLIDLACAGEPELRREVEALIAERLPLAEQPTRAVAWRHRPRRVGRYEILHQIGQGGMGVVYRARDPRLDREVAIKMLPPTELDAASEERFQREARIVAAMDHPAIVPIHDLGRHQGSIYFVMPLVTGTTLRQLIGEGSLELAEILEIGAQVAEALDYSHGRGVVHRDVKPANVMVTREEGMLRARVMDFGVAHTASAERPLTRTGDIVGTLTYVSPEQIDRPEVVDGRADLYALGAVLYECLTGRPPFTGTVQVLINRILHQEPVSLRVHGVSVDRELDDLILGCLAKDPSARPARGKELAAGLRQCAARLASGDRVVPRLDAVPRVSAEPPPPLPLVGREVELRRLREQLAAALAGECQLTLIGGEAGMGKSRLLDEALRLARTHGARVLCGRFSSRDSTFPFQGLCELIQDAFRRDPKTGTGRGGDLDVDLSDLAPGLLALFPVLSEIEEIRRAGDAAAVPAPAPRAVDDPTAVFELLARTFGRLAGGRPLVLALENLHACDVSIDALQYAVHRLGPTPTWVLGTYRHTEIEHGHPLRRLLRDFSDDPRCRHLLLEPLSQPALRQLIAQQVGGQSLRDDLVARLYEATEGNPFFTRELLASLIESGGIQRDRSGSWSLLREPGALADALPVSIHQAVEQRLERLAPELQRVLAVAAVLGRSFDYQDLEALLGETDELEETIDALVRQGILEEERKTRGDRLRFVSGIVRDILYAGIPRRRRRALHRRHARRLESRYRGREERVYAQLVHHFSEGDVPERTVTYARKLARAALEACCYEDALRVSRTALEFVDEEEVVNAATVEGDLRQIRAVAQRALGHVSRALREAERAAEILARVELWEPAARAALLAAETAWQGRQVERARRWIELGCEQARRGAAGDALKRLLTLGATVANLGGDHRQAQALLAEAEALAPPSTVPADEPVAAGGTLVTAMPRAISSLDPSDLESDEELEIAAILFDTLLAADEEGNPVPLLCRRWQAAEDGRTFILKLRPDVRFSDGTPLTAGVVKASLERAAGRRRDPPAAFHTLVGYDAFVGGSAPEIEGIEAPADDELRFRLSEPLPLFPALLTAPTTAIVRPRSEAQGGGLAGTGPFRLARREERRILLERNPADWREAKPHLEGIEVRTFSEALDIASGLRAGTIDVARDLLPEDLESLLRDPRWRAGLVEATRKNVYFVLLNTAGPSARQLALRRALAGVVRVRDLVWRTLGRFARPAVSLIPPGVLGHDPGRRRPVLSRQQARELLAGAGLEPPIRVRAAIHPLLQDRYGGLTAALIDEWGALGVEVYFEMTTSESFHRAYHDNADVDLLIGRWTAEYDDPDCFTYGLFHSTGGRLRRYFASPDSDRLLERARQEREAMARAWLYQRWERQLDEAAVLLPLFHDVNYRLAHPGVRGLALHNRPPYVSYETISKVAADGAAAQPPPARGEIHVPLAVKLASLDPLAEGPVERYEAVANVFETLTRIDEGARVVPALATAVEPLPGGRGYRLVLAPEARFHDGRPCTARDVRHTFERLLRSARRSLHHLLLPICGARALRDGKAAELAGLRIHSQTELSIELDRPLALFPALLSHPALAIVPEGETCFDGDWRAGCAGTGPFRVVRFTPGERLDLERNPDYRHRDLPKSERLVFHLGLPSERIRRELAAGRLSLAADLNAADVEALRREARFAGGYRESPRLSTYLLAFNTRRGPFADAGARRSLAWQLDLDEVLAGAAGQLASRAHGIIPPGLLGHEPPRRPVVAAAPSGGVAGELRVAALVDPAYAGSYTELWTTICGRLEQSGIAVEPRFGSHPQGDVDLAFVRWVAAYPDPDSFAQGLLHSEEGLLGELCGSPELDRLIARGREEEDPSLRHALYREMEELVARELLLIPLFHEQTYRFCQPTLHGLRFALTIPEVRYEELELAS
ncbi:MAG: hypothetical protein D6696_04455 [Acidobacteria bacterium]|nr:MAG: hypothetical protein D6696_04455 [Acidobacteriota bacterium]